LDIHRTQEQVAQDPANEKALTYKDSLAIRLITGLLSVESVRRVALFGTFVATEEKCIDKYSPT
jgi:hypothetical protein